MLSCNVMCDLHNPSSVLLCVFVHETVLRVAPLPEIVVLYQTAYWFLWELGEGGEGGGGGGGG